MVRLTVDGFEPCDVEQGVSLLDACEQGKIPMESACGGFACCNSCRVEVMAGSLSETLEEELPFLDGPSQRLGCQAFVLSDVHIRLAPGMDV